ncbi:MAG: hypothetical protein PHE83_16570 [Opitutaceae bacterium]|nr:hypothetical protein [Opitutaceae bacterium]
MKTIRFFPLALGLLLAVSAHAETPTDMMRSMSASGVLTLGSDQTSAALVFKNTGDHPVIIEQLFVGPDSFAGPLTVPAKDVIRKEFTGKGARAWPGIDQADVSVAIQGVSGPVSIGKVMVVSHAVAITLGQPRTSATDASRMIVSNPGGAVARKVDTVPADKMQTLQKRLDALETEQAVTVAGLIALAAGLAFTFASACRRRRTS